MVQSLENMGKSFGGSLERTLFERLLEGLLLLTRTYIPLFSAAYSRYLKARPDAPFIISLINYCRWLV